MLVALLQRIMHLIRTYPPEPEDLRRVKKVAHVPVVIGSSLTPENFADYFDAADGFIVGTAFKRDGLAMNAVDPARVKSLLGRLR